MANRARLHIRNIRPGNVYRDRGHRTPTFRVVDFDKGWLKGAAAVIIEYMGTKIAGRTTLNFILNRCYLLREAL